jgi:hypothetical protein
LPRAQTLFGQFLQLVGYVKLRQDLAAEPDDLIGVFANARRTFAVDVNTATAEQIARQEVCERLATIIRRDPQTVVDTANVLHIVADAQPDADPPTHDYPVTVPGLVNEQGIGRLWQVLALAKKLGISPIALGHVATPEPGLAVARYVRDSVKARYEPGVWRRVVQPIADKLRRRRRDALVDHVMHTHQFDRVEQLFEFFLIDPGTEPVVQTSRLRLAISAVQLFIQRCLLNLELQVSPAGINAAHWQWMKRYRVWEANRKIFLWPENWLEPEFRDEKSHLFTALESTLLQSDLSNDSAEDAFFAYLKGLEEIARLDIRAVHLQQKTDPADNVLHVVGRTFSGPHKYLYRRYAHQRWTPWEPLGVEIDGEHIALTVWHGRVHVFWVTFIEEAGKADAGSTTTKKTTELTLGDIAAMDPTVRVQLQLNWVQRVQDEWSPRASSDILTARMPIYLFTPKTYVRNKEFIHATVAADGAVLIHITGYLNWAIRLVSRNAPPKIRKPAESPLAPPYVGLEPAGRGRYEGEDHLTAGYYAHVTTNHYYYPTYSCWTYLKILAQSTPYEIVTHPSKLSGFHHDVGKLVAPFFYSDDWHTFYVEPSLTETVIEESDGWILNSPIIAKEYDEPQQPAWQIPIGPDPVEQISPEAIYTIQTPSDWVTRADTTVEFGNVLIGPAGGIFLEETP